MKLFIPLILATSFLAAELPELSIKDLKKEDVERMEKGEHHMILHVEKGEELPLFLDLKSDAIAFKNVPKEGTLVAQRPFYILVDHDEFLFSEDRVNFLPPWEFFTGRISFGLGVKNQSFISFNLEANVR